MTLEEIRELIKIVTETGIAELELQRGENRVRIRRNLDAGAHHVVAPAAVEPPAAQVVARNSQPSPAANTPPPAAPAPSSDQLAEAAMDPSLLIVKSPIVGTFYEAPSPEAPPFVQPGDTVQPGQVLCIIESMKLMNEIEAEMAGVVVSKLVANAQPVEYGEALFAVRPI
jgi:acetyl-CoA carboxylase biotin carboxyl carrier protein